MKKTTAKSLFIILFGTLALGITACGDDEAVFHDDGNAAGVSANDCTTVCNDVATCPNSEPDMQCDMVCAQQVKLAQASSCEAFFSAFLDCADDAATTCDDKLCAAKEEALKACLTNYCDVTNPTDPVCADSEKK